MTEGIGKKTLGFPQCGYLIEILCIRVKKKQTNHTNRVECKRVNDCRLLIRRRRNVPPTAHLQGGGAPSSHSCFSNLPAKKDVRHSLCLRWDLMDGVSSLATQRSVAYLSADGLFYW